MENEPSRATKKGDHHLDANSGNQNHNKPSKSELLASAKVMADAARRRGENKIDKAEVAGAAANLLHAASEYGKLEDKPLGKYVEKAENHLRHYHTSHPTNTTTTTGHSSTSHNHPGKDHGHGHPSEHSGGDDHGGKGKYEDYIKLAEGLAEGILKKQSGGGGSHSTDTSSSANTHSGTGVEEHEHGGGHSGTGNGYGQYVKMAGDFLKKH